MTNVNARNVYWGWDFAGATTWKKFPIIKGDVPSLLPERNIEKTNSPGFPVEGSHYVNANPVERALDMYQQSFVWLAIVCGSDKFLTPEHLLVDEQTPTADAQFGYDGEKLVDIAIDDQGVSPIVRYLLEDVLAKKIKFRAAFGEVPTMETTFSIPKVTLGDPGGTDVPFEIGYITPMKDCSFKLNTNTLEIAWMEVTLEAMSKPANIIGKEQQEKQFFTNWKYEVEVEAYFQTNYGITASYPAVADQNVDCVFGNNALTHYVYFDFDGMIEDQTEITFKGDDFVMMRKKYVPDLGSKTKITVEDAQWNGGTPAAYW